jgi:DNA-binding response OmpR family regulator
MQETKSPRRIVVADDEQDIADLLTMHLEMEGYQVEAVYDGQAALDAVRTTRPDFVLLDVMMPRVNGLEVLRRLKEDPTTSDIPVLMLTAKAGDEDVWSGWQLGAAYYLTKPFDLDDLVRYLTSIGLELDRDTITL